MNEKDYSLEGQYFEWILGKLGWRLSFSQAQTVKVLGTVLFCWLPLLVLSLANGNFWTGSVQGSFITSVEAQSRFLISLPILILAEPFVNGKLRKTLKQFLDAGLIPSDRIEEFHTIVKRKTRILQNPWVDLLLLAICYVQVASILFFETQYTSLAAWQFDEVQGEETLNYLGIWAVGVSRPITLYFIYKWILRVVLWGRMLSRISKLDLALVPFHADKVGGLGFLAFSVAYFGPLCFAISATLAGNVADLMLVDGMKLADFRLMLLGYMVFVTIFFTYPMFVFSRVLLRFKEKSIFDLYDGAQHVYNSVNLRVMRDGVNAKTNPEDVALLGSISDYNAVLENVLNMRAIPFQLRDLFPLWAMAIFPFFFVILIEIPLTEIMAKLISALF